MFYALEQGDHEQEIIKQCFQAKKPLPKRIQNAPDLWLGLDLYLDGFWDLDTCRPTDGSGLNPIPWYAIRKWIREYELDEEQAESFEYIIRRLDNKYLKKKVEIAQRKTPPPPSNIRKNYK